MMTDANFARRVRGCAIGTLTIAALALIGCSAAHSGPSLSDAHPCSSTTFPGPLGGGGFTSIRGTDAADSQIDWLSFDPISIAFDMQNDTSTLVVTTPCNTINVPAAITTTEIHPDVAETTVGTKGCRSPAGDREAWTRRFLSEVIRYDVSEDTLTVRNDLGIILLERSVD